MVCETFEQVSSYAIKRGGDGLWVFYCTSCSCWSRCLVIMKCWCVLCHPWYNESNAALCLQTNTLSPRTIMSEVWSRPSLSRYRGPWCDAVVVQSSSWVGLTDQLVSFTGLLGFTSPTDVNRLHADHETIEYSCCLLVAPAWGSSTDRRAHCWRDWLRHSDVTTWLRPAES